MFSKKGEEDLPVYEFRSNSDQSDGELPWKYGVPDYSARHMQRLLPKKDQAYG